MPSLPPRQLKDVNEVIDSLNKLIPLYVDRMESFSHLLAIPKVKYPLGMMERVAFNSDAELAHIVAMARKSCSRAYLVSDNIKVGAEYVSIIDANYSWSTSVGRESLASRSVALVVERIAEYHKTVAREMDPLQVLDDDGYAALAAVLQGQVIQIALLIFRNSKLELAMLMMHAHGERYEGLRNVYQSTGEVEREAQTLFDSTRRMAEQYRAQSRFPPTTTLELDPCAYQEWEYM